MNIENCLGVDYRRQLVAVAEPSGTMNDAATGKLIPLQSVPALVTDGAATGEVVLALLDLAPQQRLTLERTSEDVPVTIRVEARGDVLEIINGDLAVRVPCAGAGDGGPLVSVRVGNRPWLGRSTVTAVAGPVSVSSRIVSHGPCLVQWETRMAWPGGGTLKMQMRWATGSDTILVVEEGDTDTGGAWTWEPLWPERGRALSGGGGEQRGAMQELQAPADGSNGPRVIQRMGHVAYFNQCHLAWLGFAGDDGTFAGLFTGWGSVWQRRGHMWIDIIENGDAGHSLSFPVKQGRRAWGLCLSTRAEAGVDTPDDRCLLNRRKAQHADLPLSKVQDWLLDGALPAHEPVLVQRADLDGFRVRLAASPEIVKALDSFTTPNRHLATSLAVWRGDLEAMRAAGRDLAVWARGELAEIADGGYEKLIIFQGRQAKSFAYDLDVLWALGGIDEADYRAVRKTLLALAWMFADGDYCNPEDFWAQVDPDSGVVEKLAPHMGGCPVPPNFLLEFSSTVGVVAEWATGHPQAAAWRKWSLAVLDRFLEHWFLPDGTYREAVNYHTHSFNALLCHLYPLRIRGGRDYFSHPRVRGSFEHFIAIQMPVLQDQLPPGKAHNSLYAGDGKEGYAPMPANGNSGGHGHEQQVRAEFSLGAAVYRQTDSTFSGLCLHSWVAGGKLILDDVHPMLTMLTLDPSIPAVTPLFESVHRQSMGLVSKAFMPNRQPVWCLFRAGSATNHMDFDQGGLHLAFAGQVLLGDHGYHTVNQAGKSVAAWATYLHSTVTYAEDRNLTSGYTGLEQAPEPLLARCTPEFDWCVHRIVNNNFRNPTRFPYNYLIPAVTTRHVRHYLFVKPDYFLVWDVFEEAHAPATFWLHPKAAVVQESPTVFRAGTPGAPHLGIHFLTPDAPSVVENEAGGPLWSFAVKAGQGEPFLVLLAPQLSDRHIRTTYEASGRRRISVMGDGLDDSIWLPEPGQANELPKIERKTVFASKHSARDDREA